MENRSTKVDGGNGNSNGGYQMPNDYEESNTTQMQQSQQILSAH